MSYKKAVVKVTGFSEILLTKNGHPQRKYDLLVVEDGEHFSVGDTLEHWDVMGGKEEYFLKNARNYGMVNDDISNPEGIGTIKAQVVLSLDEWNGEANWRVKYVNPWPAKGNSMDSDSLEAFTARLAAKLENIPPVERCDENSVEPPL